jgi:hypothetical protein
MTASIVVLALLITVALVLHRRHAFRLRQFRPAAPLGGILSSDRDYDRDYDRDHERMVAELRAMRGSLSDVNRFIR